MRVSRDTWLTPWDLGNGPESRDIWSTTWAQEPGLSPPGQLVNPAVHRERARGSRDSCSTVGPRTWSGVTWDSWSTPRALGLNSESLETAGRPRWLSDMHPRPSELLVNTTQPRVQSPVAQDRWSTPRALGHGPESPRAPVRQCGTSYQGRSHPGQLVNHGHSETHRSFLGKLVEPAGPQTRARVAQES